MIRLLVALLVALPLSALAQSEPGPRIIVVPYPGEVADGGVTQAAPVAQPVAAPPPAAQVAPPPPIDVPPPMPETRTVDAMLPPPLPQPEAVKPPAPPEPGAPGAFLDGHPREGAFLSGPGSMTFVLHHTILGGVGLLATQLIPRIADGADWGGQDARVAYLAGTLIGAGVGFGASAWWQFNNWQSQSSAYFALGNSAVGAMFMAGFANLFTNNATALNWLGLIGAEAGAWLTTVVGGGDMPMNRGTFIASGAGWAMIYTALIIAMVSSSGSRPSAQGVLDALLITPALGAAAMAAASLKFNPSTAQILRADLFGVGVGGAVLVLSALILGFNFASPVPYLLGGIGAIGAKTVVSLLWAEAAETPGKLGLADEPADRRRVSVWW